MTRPLEATNEEELLDALLQTDQEIDWVPRRLLIESIGVEHAEDFLPPLIDNVSVSVKQLLLTYKAFYPQKLEAAFQRKESSEQ